MWRNDDEADGLKIFGKFLKVRYNVNQNERFTYYITRQNYESGILCD